MRGGGVGPGVEQQLVLADRGAVHRGVEGDRVLEQRRALIAAAVVRVRAAGLLVGVLVAEEVAGVHQLEAAALGRSAPAIRRPSVSSASTSSGVRAST